MARTIGIDLGSTGCRMAFLDGGVPRSLADPNLAALVGIEGTVDPSTQITARLLRQLKASAEDQIGEAFDEAVIAVPSVLGYVERQAVRDAARTAGLRCARLIGRATAAALAYGFESRDEGVRFVAVYALGGTALDIAILEMADGLLRVRATRGAPLGGTDVDRHDEELSLCLRDAGLEPERLDEVLLVGEQTRSSHVRRAVHELFGKPTKRAADDGVVARGAAIQAGIKEGHVEDLCLLDVTPHTLGVETKGGTFTPLVSRNSTIPTRRSLCFTTAGESQRRAEVHVLEGESDEAGCNTSLARLGLSNISHAPGSVARIEVCFEIDLDGILTVSATDQATGLGRAVVVTPSAEATRRTGMNPGAATDLVVL